MGAAPICHVSVDQVIEQPTRSTLPFISPANDLDSALLAIQQLTQLVNQLAGRLNSDRGGQGGKGGQKPPKIGRYQEQRQYRVTEKKKIYNPDDKDQWVEVERINRLIFKDTVTGELWEWNR